MTEALDERRTAPATPLDPPPATGGAPGLPSPRRSALQLLAVLVGVVALSAATGHLDLFVVIASIVVIVMLHELGHLLAAKHGGMKVTEYFVGFGPRIWSFRWGETEYGVKALPLGGYVKIPGMTNLEEVDPADEARSYRQAPFRARLLVGVAGSAMHFLIALVLIWCLLSFVGVPNANQIEFQAVGPVAGRPGPAQVAGVRPGDVVVSIDGKAVGGNVTAVTGAVHSHPDAPLTVVVERNGHERTLTVTPANGRVEHEQGVVAPSGTAPFGVIGVAFGEPVQRTNPLRAVASTPENLWNLTRASVVGVGHIFTPGAISQRFNEVGSAKAADQAAANGTRTESIVGIVNTATQAAQAGIGEFLSILIVINVFFGVFNLFPMLPLDGGHVAIAVYEKIRTGRRRVAYHADAAKLLPFTWAMLALLGIVVVPALLTDILHPMANPFG
jgi:membrane-associated protease RseP (regulator of RpoE activity)